MLYRRGMADSPSYPTWREVPVPDVVDGMRLDRFLSKRFMDLSRTFMARAIRKDQVRDVEDRPLRASAKVRGGTVLRIYIPGLAPTTPPPPFPEILFEDDRVVVVHKPPGMMAHPGGTRWCWALVSLAKMRWPDVQMDIVHRLDRDTSGALVLTKDSTANAFLKREMLQGRVHKEYLAITKGHVDFETAVLEGPIGKDGGEIRVKMGVRDNGLAARTDVTLEALHPEYGLSKVRCRLHTGRTHQIRVHLTHAGFPLLGDRLYGVPPAVFLSCIKDGPTSEDIILAGAARQALHAAHIELAHPDGGRIDVEVPLPEDMRKWWAHPADLPWGGLNRVGLG